MIQWVCVLTSIVSASNHTKCMSLSNRKCMNQPTLINLHPNEYGQELHQYPFVVNLNRCAGSCNILEDLSNKVFVPNKTDDLNLSVFNIISGTNQSKILTKYISFKCKCKCDGRKCGIMINVDVSGKNITFVDKIMFGILLHIVEKLVNI